MVVRRVTRHAIKIAKVFCVSFHLGFCSSMELVARENSEICREAQKYSTGCHACGRVGCYISAIDCHAKHIVSSHVCGPGDVNLGCTSRGRVCHQNNSDLRCPYYQRARGQLTWSTTNRERMDTQNRSQGNVPHMTQIQWNFNGRTNQGSIKLLVNGRHY